MFPKRFPAWTVAFAAAALLLFAVPAAVGQGRGTVVFRAEPARGTSGLRDALEVTYTLVDIPRLASLTLQASPDFTVLPGQADRQSTTTDITPQGPVQSTTLTRTYTLQPRRTGKLVLPVAIARTSDGRVYRSNAADVTIVAGSAPGPRSSAGADPFGGGTNGPDPLAGLPSGVLPPGFDPWERVVPNPADVVRSLPRRSDLPRRLFLEILPEKHTAWVGEPVTIRYRLAGSVDARGSLTKLPTPDGFWVQDLSAAQTAPEDTSIGGQWFQALLLKRAAFIPQRAGTLVIDPAEMNATTDVAGPGGAPEAAQIHLKSAPVTLTVRPLPAGAPAAFNGAVGRFTVTAKLDHNRIGADGTALLTVAVEGTGNLTQIEAPAVSIPEGLSADEPGIQDALPPDAPHLQGRRTFAYALTPGNTGSYQIPPVAFVFFDPAAGRYQTVQTAPLSLDVLEGPSPAAVSSESPAPPRQSWLWWSLGGAALLGAGIWAFARTKRRPAPQPNLPRAQPAPPAAAAAAAPPRPAAATPLLRPPTTLKELLPQLRRGLDAQLGHGVGYLPQDALRQHLEAAGWEPYAALATPRLLHDIESALYGGGQQDQAALLDDALALWQQLYLPKQPS